MPVAKFQMPDGRIARFEVPEGTSPEQAQSLIEAQLPSLTAAAKPSEWDTEAPLPEGIPGPRASSMLPEATPQAARDILAGLYTGTLAGEDPVRRAMIEQATGGIPSSRAAAAGEMLSVVPRYVAPMIAGMGATAAMGAGATAAGLPTLGRALTAGGFGKDIGFATRALAGGVTGAASGALASPTFDQQTLMENAMAGGAVGAALPAVAAPVLGAAAEGVGRLMDVRQMPNQLAAKIMKDVLGSPENVLAARSAMQQAEAQGLDLTAQQALARSGMVAPATQATLEAAVKKTAAVDARALKETAQEAARKSTIKGMTPDLAAAIEARRAASAPLYEAADKTAVAVDGDLAQVISRIPENVLSEARKIAKMEGRPFVMGEIGGAEPATVSGETLHTIKRALSDLAYGPSAATGVGRDTQKAAQSLLQDYLGAFEARVPAYAQARQTFADLSAPVNQAQVLREMASVLEKPGGGERIAPFLNVLGRGEQAMLKRAGGRGGPRFQALNEVLTPDQLSKVREVAKQLETEASIGKQVTEGSQRFSDLIKEELPNIGLPNIFNVWATSANNVLGRLSQKLSQKTLNTLANSALSAKSFDDLLATLPQHERSKFLKIISDPDTWTSIGRVGASAAAAATAQPSVPTNAIAPAQPNNNALSR